MREGLLNKKELGYGDFTNAQPVQRQKMLKERNGF